MSNMAIEKEIKTFELLQESLEARIILGTLEITGTIEKWFFMFTGTDGSYNITGNIYNDSDHRFGDGTSIITSSINARDYPKESLKEGMIICTRNSTYLLGEQIKVI